MKYDDISLEQPQIFHASDVDGFICDLRMYIFDLLIDFHFGTFQLRRHLLILTHCPSAPRLAGPLFDPPEFDIRTHIGDCIRACVDPSTLATTEE